MADQVYTPEQDQDFTQQFHALGHDIRRALGLLHIHREKTRRAAFCHSSHNCPISVAYSVIALGWSVFLESDRERLRRAGWNATIYCAFLDWFDAMDDGIREGRGVFFRWLMSQETLPHTA